MCAVGAERLGEHQAPATEGSGEPARWWNILIFFTIWILAVGGIAFDVGSTGLSLIRDGKLAIIYALLWLMPFLLTPVLISERRRQRTSNQR